MRYLFVMMVIAMLHGCASGVAAGYGQGGRGDDGRSYQEARGDNQLTAAVNSALVRDKSLPAFGIEAQSRDGVVTLTGKVASRALAERAVTLVRSVPGVKAVRDELRIAQ